MYAAVADMAVVPASEMVPAPADRVQRITGYPEGLLLNYVGWSPEGKYIAFTTRSPGKLTWHMQVQHVIGCMCGCMHQATLQEPSDHLTSRTASPQTRAISFNPPATPYHCSCRWAQRPATRTP